MTWRLVAAVTALCALGGCAGGPAAGDGDRVTVFAAASLTETFTELGGRFAETYPGEAVVFEFQSSSTLARQVVQGARVDVFAAANRQTMATVVDAGMVDDAPAVLVRNRLQIAVPSGNPAGVRTLADLARPDLTLALCASQVPCGAASATVLRAAGVNAVPDTYDKDVKAVMARLTLGEVDAALVYRTDVRAAADRVDGIDFPEAAEAVNDYPIVRLADAPRPSAAGDFLAFVRSDEARQVFADAGFELP